MKARLLLAAVAVFGALAGGAVAASSSDEDRLREQLRSTVLQLREAQDGQAALLAQKAAAEQERDALKAKGAAGPSKAQLQAARRGAAQAAQLKQDLDKARADLAQSQEAGRQTQAQLDQAKGLYAKASDDLRRTQAERDGLQASLASARAIVVAAEAKNAQLTAVADEILEAYARFSVARAVLGKEPFTGLERVKLENIAQAYADKVRDARFDPRTASAPKVP